jgi:hypothetical protein
LGRGLRLAHAAASAFKLPFLAEPTKLIERWQQLRDLINATEPLRMARLIRSNSDLLMA